jgi:flagellar motor switch protein FliN/FliY
MTTTAPTSTAAQAVTEFARSLPSDRALRADPANAAAAPAVVFEASHVGAATIDLAVGFADAGFLETGDGLSPEHLLHPALQAAAGVYGTGVLGEVRRREGADPADAGLLADSGAAVFELLDGTELVGWIAVRERASGSRPTSTTPTDSGRLGRISGVEMALTVEIGRTRMTVRDILNLEPGAVVELDRSAGAPADILLNGRVIAHGEVVVVDQDYAVRVTRILDAQDSGS